MLSGSRPEFALLTPMGAWHEPQAPVVHPGHVHRQPHAQQRVWPRRMQERGVHMVVGGAANARLLKKNGKLETIRFRSSDEVDADHGNGNRWKKTKFADP